MEHLMCSCLLVFSSLSFSVITVMGSSSNQSYPSVPVFPKLLLLTVLPSFVIPSLTCCSHLEVCFPVEHFPFYFHVQTFFGILSLLFLNITVYAYSVIYWCIFWCSYLLSSRSVFISYSVSHLDSPSILLKVTCC